ncbi:hypothetical protein [Aeromicrobium sp. UC242_57]|uniref:hypothetical protein n=1 Tax=Aeromicrobium sp. UC242_57 TaxID=3374624 RepID=UPI0037924754
MTDLAEKPPPSRRLPTPTEGNRRQAGVGSGLPARRLDADRGSREVDPDHDGAERPAPAATTKAPSLTDITDPLLGGLLGDDEQEGLVPGLLNGLLGNKK